MGHRAGRIDTAAASPSHACWEPLGGVRMACPGFRTQLLFRWAKRRGERGRRCVTFTDTGIWFSLEVSEGSGLDGHSRLQRKGTKGREPDRVVENQSVLQSGPPSSLGPLLGRAPGGPVWVMSREPSAISCSPTFLLLPLSAAIITSVSQISSFSRKKAAFWS